MRRANVQTSKNLKNMQLKCCPNCLKIIIHTELRMAELPPCEVIGYNKTRNKLVIGKIFYHKDGTICDQTIRVVKELKKPVYLRLGDSTRDPRT